MKLVVNNIKKNYKKNCVLNGASFDGKSSECIGILGGNGSGKTTLLSSIAGICTNVSGEIYLIDEETSERTNLTSRHIAYVPQINPLMEELSGRDNLSLWYSKKTLELSLKKGILYKLGIHEFVDMRVSEMSGGMKKRLAIGCSMNTNSQIVLFDEPTAALDLNAKAEMYNFLTELKNENRIIILVTHDIEEIKLCDKLYIFKNGKLYPYIFNGDSRKLAEDISE